VPPFLQRLSPRERILVLITAGACFAFGNLLFLSYLFETHDRSRAALASSQLAWKLAQLDLADEPLTQSRTAWLARSQPKLGQTSPQRAGGELLDQVKHFADASKVLLQNPQVLGAETPAAGSSATTAAAAASRQDVAISIVAVGDWKSLVDFLTALQAKPEAFIVPEVATLRSEPNDPQRMRAELRIARWYAPAGS